MNGSMPDNENTEMAYMELDRRVKRSCRQDKQDWIDQKGHEGQEAVKKNDTKTLYCIVCALV